MLYCNINQFQKGGRTNFCYFIAGFVRKHMKNKSVLLSVFLSLLLVFFSFATPVYAKTEAKTTSNDITFSYYDIAHRLNNAKVIKFKSKDFKLDEKITRQEAVSMALDILGYNITKTNIHFIPYTDDLTEVIIEGEMKNGETFKITKRYEEPLEITKVGFEDVPAKSPKNERNAVIIAKALGLVKGSKGKFGWDKNITVQKMYELMLRVLDYKVSSSNALSKAKSLGLNDNIHISAKKELNRGQLCQIVYNTLLAERKSSERPLQDDLGIKINDVEAPELSKLDVYSERKVILTFSEDIERINAKNICITNSRDKEIEKFSVTRLADNVYGISSSEFAYDEKYEIKIKDVKDKIGNVTDIEGFFKGIKKDYSNFQVKSIDVLRPDTIKINFNKHVDKYSLPDNFVEIKDIGIKETEMEDTALIVKTELLEKDKVYEMQLRSVKSWSGNSVQFTRYLIKYDTKWSAFRVLEVKSIGDEAVKIIFGYEVEKEFAEDTGNYAITNGLGIKSAKLLADGRTVILTTTPQDYRMYDLYIVHKETNEHVKESFFGKQRNSSTGYLIHVDRRNSNEIEVLFSKEMDVETVMNKDNWLIKDLGIMDVQPVYNENDSYNYHKRFRIITTDQKPQTYYQVQFENLYDEHGNAVRSSYHGFYSMTGEKTLPTILGNGYRVNNYTIRINFSEKVSKESVENISNYRISGMNTPPIRAVMGTDERSVLLELNELDADKKYSIIVSNIEDLYGNIIETTRVVCE